jgi:hypothetical protein
MLMMLRKQLWVEGAAGQCEQVRQQGGSHSAALENLQCR